MSLFLITVGIPMAKKKIAELELSLLHLQQNVEIPEISLSIHPAVQRAIDEVLLERFYQGAVVFDGKEYVPYPPLN